MTDSSIRFVPELFFQRAIAAPEIYPIFEEQEFSLYLKEHVFDKLSERDFQSGAVGSYRFRDEARPSGQYATGSEAGTRQLGGRFQRQGQKNRRSVKMCTHVFLRWPMYDHEYEWQILGFLRILKYIWQRNKSILADLVRDYRCGEIDTEDIFELSVMLLVEYICVDYLPEDDPNDFYGEEYTCYLLMESELDDFLTLIAQIETLRFRTTECTGRNKLRDAVEMFMGNVLYDFKIVPCEAGCVIYLWPPPDYYDPIEFANSIIDLMAYIGAEIDRMKAELAELTAAEQEMEVAA